MGERIIGENPHVQTVKYTLPNKHYIPVDMRYAGIDNLTPYVVISYVFFWSLSSLRSRGQSPIVTSCVCAPVEVPTSSSRNISFFRNLHSPPPVPFPLAASPMQMVIIRVSVISFGSCRLWLLELSIESAADVAAGVDEPLVSYNYFARLVRQNTAYVRHRWSVSLGFTLRVDAMERLVRIVRTDEHGGWRVPRRWIATRLISVGFAVHVPSSFPSLVFGQLCTDTAWFVGMFALTFHDGWVGKIVRAHHLVFITSF